MGGGGVGIGAGVKTAERQHRHWTLSALTNRAGRSGGRLRGHRRAEINTVTPIEGLIHEGHCTAAASAENDGADRHAFAFFDIRIERRVVAHRRSESAGGLRGLLFGVGRPIIATPIYSVSGWRA